MVKPSSLGFFEVSMGAAAAGRSATADAALTEDAESETLRRAPAQEYSSDNCYYGFLDFDGI